LAVVLEILKGQHQLTSMMELKTIFVLVFLASLASGNEGEKPNRHSELLKPETNSIDHGPSKHKSGHLLGYKGENWSLLKKKRKNNKKKSSHSLDGSHHDNLDDIRLQDLSYIPSKKVKEPKNEHKARYFKKLQHYKAKMMGKKKSKIHHKKINRKYSRLP